MLTLERNTLTVDQERWCADWLMQFLWAIENETEQLTNLYVPHRSTNPRGKGTYDPKDGKIDTSLTLLSPHMPRPELWAYSCYIPPHEALDFPGVTVWLYPEEVPQIGEYLRRERVFAFWYRYKEGGNYQVWYHHRVHNRMQLTRKARAENGIEQASIALYRYFESAIRQIVSKGVLD